MIKLSALICFNPSSIISGNFFDPKELIAEEFDNDDCLWEALIDQICEKYGDEDDNFTDFLSEGSLAKYIVSVNNDKATIEESRPDYVTIRTPFEFDDELAFKDFQAK